MPRYRYLGGAQCPDDLGYVEPGDVRELARKPEVGEWEPVTAAAPAPAASSKES